MDWFLGLICVFTINLGLLGSDLSSIGDITQDDRTAVLETIKSLAPELYTEITDFDPTGVNHIILNQDDMAGISMSCLTIDGLPLIRIGTDFIAECPNLRAVIAHELGHYIHGHMLFGNRSGLNEYERAEFALSDLLLFDRAYQRLQEHEANQSAVLDFGIAPTEMIQWLKGLDYPEWAPPSQQTFSMLHPSGPAMISYLKGLDRELKFRRYWPKRIIDWPEMAERYFLSGRCRN